MTICDGIRAHGRIASPLNVSTSNGYGKHDGVTVRDARGYVVAVAIADVPELDPDGLARLIAAAPDMLQALHVVGMSAGWQYMTMETRALVDAAIAKAQGLADAHSNPEGR